MGDYLFTHNTVVVTSTGKLGQAIARRFALRGAHVIIADADAVAGTDAVQALQLEGVSAAFESLNRHDPIQIRLLVDKIVNERQHIDIWVNSAGIVYDSPAEHLLPEAWEDTLSTVLSSTFFCSQAVGQHMLAEGKGVVINIASVHGYKAIEGYAANCTAQAGLIMLTQALGIEWAKRGVRVVGIAPTLPNSRQDIQQDTSLDAAYIRRTPMRRIATMDDMADTVLFLASEEASYITAVTLRVDGGWGAYQLF